MKCKACGSELTIKDGLYICEFCGSKYFKEEIEPNNHQENTQHDFNIRGGVILSYKGNQSTVLIPTGVVAIGPGAFKNNLSIQKVVFSSSVIEIQNNAFEGCSYLKAITGYENVQSFGEDSFRASGLEEVTIGSEVRKLDKGCFSSMPNLKKVIYKPQKILRLKNTFYDCVQLRIVEMDQFYFFPSMHLFLEVGNNPDNKRPTFGDAFRRTPYIEVVKNELLKLYERGICPECGGEIQKGLFHAKCSVCGIDYKN